jgi:hypothetical protein
MVAMSKHNKPSKVIVSWLVPGDRVRVQSDIKAGRLGQTHGTFLQRNKYGRVEVELDNGIRYWVNWSQVYYDPGTDVLYERAAAIKAYNISRLEAEYADA